MQGRNSSKEVKQLTQDPKSENHICNYLEFSVEKAMAPHSSTLAWKLPWMEKPGRLQSMGSLRVGHSWATSLSLFIFMHWRRKWQPTPVFLPGESQGQGSLVGCRLWGPRVGHDWSDLAAAVAVAEFSACWQLLHTGSQGKKSYTFRVNKLNTSCIHHHFVNQLKAKEMEILEQGYVYPGIFQLLNLKLTIKIKCQWSKFLDYYLDLCLSRSIFKK